MAELVKNIGLKMVEYFNLTPIRKKTNSRVREAKAINEALYCFSIYPSLFVLCREVNLHSCSGDEAAEKFKTHPPRSVSVPKKISYCI